MIRSPSCSVFSEGFFSIAGHFFCQQKNEPGKPFPHLKLKAFRFGYAGLPGILNYLCRSFLPFLPASKMDTGTAWVGEQWFQIFLPKDAVHASAHQPGMEYNRLQRTGFLSLAPYPMQDFGVDKKSLIRHASATALPIR